MQIFDSELYHSEARFYKEISEATFGRLGIFHILTDVNFRPSAIYGDAGHAYMFCKSVNRKSLANFKDLSAQNVERREICRICVSSLKHKVIAIVTNLKGILFNLISQTIQSQDIILQIFERSYRLPTYYLNISNGSSVTGDELKVVVCAQRGKHKKLFEIPFTFHIPEELKWSHNSLEETIRYASKKASTEIVNYFGPIGVDIDWIKETEIGAFEDL